MKAIDLFAGLGGFTQAAQSVGIDVVWAANHSPLAVEFHARNHPTVAHSCQDLQQADFTQVPEHDLLLASPCCQGHFPGNAGSRHDASRATAWAVVSALEAKGAAVAVVENIPQFRSWKLYPVWKQALEVLGYSVAEVISDAADFEVPQHRVRLFVLATKSRHPISLNLARGHHRPVRDFIEWDSHCWSPVNRRGRSLKTLDRIRNGRKQHGSCFVAPYYSTGSGTTGRSLDRPIGTITTRARWSIVRDDQMRMFQPSELRSLMSFPTSYQLPTCKAKAEQLLGNAVCPGQGAGILSALQRAV